MVTFVATARLCVGRHFGRGFALKLDKLTGEERTRVCSILYERYGACVTRHAARSVLSLDPDLVPAKCGALYADLAEHCVDVLRRGEAQTSGIKARGAGGSGGGEGGAGGARR